MNAGHTNSGIYTFRDNLFSQTAIDFYASIDVCSNNAYVTTNSGFLSPTNGAVFLSNSPAFEMGALGDYYYPTNQTNLIYAGSRTAAAAGLYHYTVMTNNMIEGTNRVSIGFHYIAVDASGQPIDTTGDGLPDYVKDSNGDGVYDSGDLANWLSPFNIYDQGTTFLGWTPQNVRLGYWKFDTTDWTNQAGVHPTTNTGLTPVADWSSNAVSLNSSGSQLVYPVSSNNGQSYLDVANGTVRFWYQPNWSTTNSSAPGEVDFLVAGYSTNAWQFCAKNTGSCGLAFFCTWSNQYNQQSSFDCAVGPGTLVNFQANLWYQIVLTYSPTNVALYTNGVLLATGNAPPLSNNVPMLDVGDGNLYYPSASYLGGGFSFGSQFGSVPVMGQLDEFETFNYAMTAQQVAAGYPTFAGNSSSVVMSDSNYVGRSDMLQKYVDGNPSNIVQCRLGYWRFDSPELISEQGQIPKSQSGVTLVPSWSGTAASIGGSSSSQLTYCDVGANGWANINHWHPIAGKIGP